MINDIFSAFILSLSQGFPVIETKVEELIEEVEKLQVDWAAAKEAQIPNKGLLLYPPEKCRKAVGCYKKLYNLGKELKVHRTCLYEIVNRGYQLAALGPAHKLCL